MQGTVRISQPRINQLAVEDGETLLVENTDQIIEDEQDLEVLCNPRTSASLGATGENESSPLSHYFHAWHSLLDKIKTNTFIPMADLLKDQPQGFTLKLTPEENIYLNKLSL